MSQEKVEKSEELKKEPLKNEFYSGVDIFIAPLTNKVKFVGFQRFGIGAMQTLVPRVEVVEGFKEDPSSCIKADYECPSSLLLDVVESWEILQSLDRGKKTLFDTVELTPKFFDSKKVNWLERHVKFIFRNQEIEVIAHIPIPGSDVFSDVEKLVILDALTNSPILELRKLVEYNSYMTSNQFMNNATTGYEYSIASATRKVMKRFITPDLDEGEVLLFPSHPVFESLEVMYGNIKEKFHKFYSEFTSNRIPSEATFSI